MSSDGPDTFTKGVKLAWLLLGAVGAYSAYKAGTGVAELGEAAQSYRPAVMQAGAGIAKVGDLAQALTSHPCVGSAAEPPPNRWVAASGLLSPPPLAAAAPPRRYLSLQALWWAATRTPACLSACSEATMKAPADFGQASDTRSSLPAAAWCVRMTAAAPAAEDARGHPVPPSCHGQVRVAVRHRLVRCRQPVATAAAAAHVRCCRSVCGRPPRPPELLTSTLPPSPAACSIAPLPRPACVRCSTGASGSS